MLSAGVVNDVLVLLVSMHTDSLQSHKINFSTLLQNLVWKFWTFCAILLLILHDLCGNSVQILLFDAALWASNGQAPNRHQIIRTITKLLLASNNKYTAIYYL